MIAFASDSERDINLVGNVYSFKDVYHRSISKYLSAAAKVKKKNK